MPRRPLMRTEVDKRWAPTSCWRPLLVVDAVLPPKLDLPVHQMVVVDQDWEHLVGTTHPWPGGPRASLQTPPWLLAFPR